jgi:hypothetical protein
LPRCELSSSPPRTSPCQPHSHRRSNLFTAAASRFLSGLACATAIGRWQAPHAKVRTCAYFPIAKGNLGPGRLACTASSLGRLEEGVHFLNCNLAAI